MIDKLAQLGYEIELPVMGEGMAPGRPHIATALVRAGHVESTREAFDRFLADDRPAFVQYEKFSAADGIRLLRQSGAVPIWAHPFLFRGAPVKEILPELVEAGLMGLEVYHPSHTLWQAERLKEMCAQYGLLISGGSDFHGIPADSRADEYRSLNSLKVPIELLEPIRQAAIGLKRSFVEKSS